MSEIRQITDPETVKRTTKIAHGACQEMELAGLELLSCDRYVGT